MQTSQQEKFGKSKYILFMGGTAPCFQLNLPGQAMGVIQSDNPLQMSPQLPHVGKSEGCQLPVCSGGWGDWLDAG